jgi:hypothetical protein
MGWKMKSQLLRIGTAGLGLVTELALSINNQVFTPPVVQEHLRTFAAITAGDPAGGPIAALSQSERFHWLTAPRSTIIQTSPVHVGRCDDPAAAIDELMGELVSAIDSRNI